MQAQVLLNALELARVNKMKLQAGEVLDEEFFSECFTCVCNKHTKHVSFNETSNTVLHFDMDPGNKLRPLSERVQGRKRSKKSRNFRPLRDDEL